MNKEDTIKMMIAEIMELDYIDEDLYEGVSISPMIDREDVLEIINRYKPMLIK